MRRYQMESQRASGESSGSARACVSAGSSNLSAFSRARPPLAGPNDSAAKTATRSTARREDNPIRRAARNASESRTAGIARVCAGVASDAMPDAHFYTAATTSGDWVDAGIAILVAVVIAQVVDRLIARRGAEVSEFVTRGELSPATQTRLRVVRRLVSVGILLIGFAVAASNFDELSSVARGILASSAVLGLVVGFAARQTLANAIAGILLAITQPIRIGDLVTFEEETGEVEDMKLTYTYIRLGDGRRLIVPNERLAQSSVLNHTIAERRVQVEVSVWLPPDADLDRAMELIADENAGISVTVAEVDKEGVRLSATTWASSPDERGRAATELRARWLRLLREHALSSTEA